MLVQITLHCTRGCSHCMVDASPKGAHMSARTYADTLDMLTRLGDPVLMLSGGEPTDHPDILPFVEMAVRKGFYVMLLSHGAWLHQFPTEKRDALLELVSSVQVTDDPRYYPTRIERFMHPKVGYETHLRMLAPFGRARTAGMPHTQKTPACFNLRSATRSLGDFPVGLALLRHKGKFCCPSVDPYGILHAGETPSCHAFGLVTDSFAMLTRNLSAMSCNDCGLRDNLTPAQKAAIGES